MFEKKERVSLVVYFYYHRDIKKVKNLGDVAYTSRRGRYVVLYVDADQVEALIEQLSAQKYVKRVVPSYIKTLDQNFVGNLWRDDHMNSLDVVEVDTI